MKKKKVQTENLQQKMIYQMKSLREIIIME